jgi:hypothetical protein
MRILAQMTPHLMDGTRKERAAAVYAISAWFCMGAFLCAVLGYYVDPLLTANLSGPWLPVAGGVATAAIAMAKSA